MRTSVNTGRPDVDSHPEWPSDRSDHVRLASAGTATGIALPDWVQAGALIEPERARELGLQLLDQADLYDTIVESTIQSLAQRAEGE